MIELKIPSPEFVLAALKAGQEANFEGAVIILARGLDKSFEKELVDSWSDINDVTHNDILVITWGITKKSSGIAAFGRHVVAESISAQYSFSETFNKKFGEFLDISHYDSNLQTARIYNGSLDSHGTTDIRRTLNISEKQLPSLLIVLYRQRLEYLIELGLGQMQVSPVRLISTIAKNLDDVPYKYNMLNTKVSEMYNDISLLEYEIIKKKKSLIRVSTIGQLESVIRHINEAMVDAPDELKVVGKKLIDFLSGQDTDPDDVEKWKSCIIAYAKWRRLTKKLNKAIIRRFRNEPFETVDVSNFSQINLTEIRKLKETEINELNRRLSNIISERTTIKNNRESLNIINAFKASVDIALRELKLELKEKSDSGDSQWLNVPDHFPRTTYIVGKGIPIESKNEKEILQILRKLKDKSDNEETLLKKANDIIILKPSIMGVGIDLNELIKKVLYKEKSK